MRAALVISACFSSTLLLAQGDGVEGPWGTINGDLEGTSATTAIPYALGTGPVTEAWRLDVRAEGHDRVAGRNPITFDAAGNLYWKTSVAGNTGGIPRIVSASPDGAIRWFGNEGPGAVHGLGDVFDGSAAVVGRDAVYAVGGNAAPNDTYIVAAYRKDDGMLSWDTPLDETTIGVPSAGGGAEDFTPVLYRGKLYIVAPDYDTFLNGGVPIPNRVHQVDAATGAQDWTALVPGIAIRMNGGMTFLPDAFGPGVHGLYFHGDSGAPSDGVPDVYGVRVSASGAELAWSAEGGKAGRSHLVYASGTNILYTHTWTDYGAELYSFDPITGFLAANQNTPNTGHGFYDVGCLDFGGTDIIAGGFEGLVIRYQDPDGDGNTTDAVAFAGPTFWGEYRIYGQLLRAPDGHSVLISGTNSRSDLGADHEARVAAIDVTAGSVLWEYNTGIVADHGFTVRGGPYAGPDGKVYYFETASGSLVALEGTPPPPPRLPCAILDARCELALPEGRLTITWTVGGPPDCACERLEIRDPQSGAVLETLAADATSVVLPICGADGGGAKVEESRCIVCIGEDGSEEQGCCSFICGSGLFVRGDCNGDGQVSGTVTDAVFMLNFIFLGGPRPGCFAACNANGDGTVNITDAVFLLNFNFLGGPQPPPPYPFCGVPTSPGDFDLGCDLPSPDACI